MAAVAFGETETRAYDTTLPPQVQDDVFDKEMQKLISPHKSGDADGKFATLWQKRKEQREIPSTSIVHPRRQTEDFGSSAVVNTLDGVFGYAHCDIPAVDYIGMSRKPNHQIGKNCQRKVNMDAFNDGDLYKDEAMKQLLEVLAKKAYCKFRNVKDAFRLLDTDKSGKVDRMEMREFFEQFNLSSASADLFFDNMNPDENGELDFAVFMDRFGTVIQPGARTTSEIVKQPMNLVYGPGWLRKLG